MVTNKNPARNSSRRRSHARKVPQDCTVNIAEARREIVNALHLHRASSSLSRRPSISTSFPSSSHPEMPEPMFHTSSHHSSFLLEPLPQPEPIWSTTPPSVLLPMETQEFEWDDNLSLYSWWVGFLKALDERNGKTHEQATCPFDEEVNMECFGELKKRLDGSNHVREASSTDAEEYQSWPMDEWLTVPSTSLGGI